MIKLIAIILSSVIGAGFATGKELQVFFVRYGGYGYLFILIYIILFCLILGYFMFKDFGQSIKKISYILFFSSIVVLTSMISAIGEILTEFFSINYVLSIAFVCAMALVFTKNDLSFFGMLSAFILPIIMIYYCYVIFKNSTFILDNTTKINYLSPFMYLGLNACFTALLVNKYRSDYSKKEKITAILCVGVIMLVLMTFAMFSIPSDSNIILPMIYLSAKMSPFAKMSMVLVIIFSAFTTIISTIYSLSSFIVIKNDRITTFLSLIVAFNLALIGFDRVVVYLYSLVGVIGLGSILYLIASRKNANIKNKKEHIL